MTPSEIEKPSLDRSFVLCRHKRTRRISAIVLMVTVLYLLFGGVGYHLMSDTGRLSLVMPAVRFLDPPSAGLAVLNGFFSKTLIIPVLLLVLASWFWCRADRRLLRPVWSCSRCQLGYQSIRCPECGQVTESAMSEEVPAGLQGPRGGAEPSEATGNPILGFLRVVGFLVFSLSVVSLLVVGIYHLLFNSIIEWLLAPSGLPSSNPIAISNAVDWSLFFNGSVLPVVLLGTAGIWIWLVSCRRLARASWLCPSCSYDLSGVPCPRCDMP